jgi:hypothetical protein
MTKRGSPLDENVDFSRRARMQLEREVHEGKVGVAARLMALVTTSKAPPAIRALAASLAPSLPSVEVESMLIAALETSLPDLVAIHVCRALAFIGTAKSLESVEGLVKASNLRLQESARFAHIFVSHRLGKLSPYFDPTKVEARVSMNGPTSPFISRSLSAEHFGEACQTFAPCQFIGGIHPTAGIGISCGSERWAIIFQDSVVRSGISETLGRTAAVIGTVLQWADEHNRWSVARVVLGGPIGRNEFYIAAFRRDGVLDLVGLGSLNEPLIQLQAVTRPGALPLFLAVHWNGSTVSISGMSGLSRAPRNVVSAVVPPVSSSSDPRPPHRQPPRKSVKTKSRPR